MINNSVFGKFYNYQLKDEVCMSVCLTSRLTSVTALIMSSVGAVVTESVASLFLTDSTLVSALLSTWSWTNNKQISPDLFGQPQSVMLTSVVNMTKSCLGQCHQEDFSEGESTGSFVFSSCPFIKKRRNVRSVIFNDDITYVTYQNPSELDTCDSSENIYHEPCKYFWPKNKHFFNRQVWQAIKR